MIHVLYLYNTLDLRFCSYVVKTDILRMIYIIVQYCNNMFAKKTMSTLFVFASLLKVMLSCKSKNFYKYMTSLHSLRFKHFVNQQFLPKGRCSCNIS